ncbi:glycosyltransferase [Sphaerisporangium corydalis]|uniref:Glycosyltransferase n=1 Tax=Sphaerisporangium corydalis TaxID=1441875 RepID=A0ABV9ENL6_9ACTN|nr:glycosyltransferase [Sphaerisporangium corydalis]
MEIIARLNVGGPATQITGLSERLDRREFDHRLYAGQVEGDEAAHGEDVPAAERLPVHRIPGLGRTVRPGDDLRALAHLVGAMRRFRPHVVHTRTAKAGALGRVAACASGVGPARMHTFHGHLLHGYFTGARRSAYVRSERVLASLSHRLVAVGEQVRDDLLDAGIGRREQYSVVPPGVRIGPVPGRREARLALGLPLDAPVVAYVGRLTRVKRPDRLAATARAVLDRVPGCRFVVCGGGSLLGELERDIAPFRASFDLLGWRSDTETVYSAADVVLLTSDNEGMPLTLVEAGMTGTPVVSTRVGSVAEIVKDGETGLLAGTGPDELAAQVARLLTDPCLARLLGEAARAWTTASFSVERLVADTESLYRSLHRRRRAGRRLRTRTARGAR